MLSKGEKKIGRGGRTKGPIGLKERTTPKLDRAETYCRLQALVPTHMRRHRSLPRISRLRTCMTCRRLDALIKWYYHCFIIIILMCYTLIFSPLVIIYSSLVFTTHIFPKQLIGEDGSKPNHPKVDPCKVCAQALATAGHTKYMGKHYTHPNYTPC